MLVKQHRERWFSLLRRPKLFWTAESDTIFLQPFNRVKGYTQRISPPQPFLRFRCFFKSVVTWSEGADLSEDSKNGTPRGSLAFAFIKKINWWYGIVWVGLVTWVVVRWGFEGY